MGRVGNLAPVLAAAVVTAVSVGQVGNPAPVLTAKATPALPGLS